MVKGICKLYDNETELRNSHLYPKFVVDYLKNSGSRFLRSIIEPNRRKQDSFKKQLLSERAEQEFSQRERWFSETIFKPYLVNNVREFQYDERLFYFSISFLWRVLHFEFTLEKTAYLPFRDLLTEAEKQWKGLLGKSEYPRDFHKVYIFFTDRIESHTIDVKNADYYMTRAMDSTIIYNDNNTYVAVYGKFLRFIFWAVLKDEMGCQPEEVLINPIGGEINIPQALNDPCFSNFLLNRLHEFDKRPGPSEVQTDKIREEINRNESKFWDSDAGKSIRNDWEI